MLFAPCVRVPHLGLMLMVYDVLALRAKPQGLRKVLAVDSAISLTPLRGNDQIDISLLDCVVLILV